MLTHFLVTGGSQLQNQRLLHIVVVSRGSGNEMSCATSCYAGIVSIQMVKEPTPNVSFPYINPLTLFEEAIASHLTGSDSLDVCPSENSRLLIWKRHWILHFGHTSPFQALPNFSLDRGGGVILRWNWFRIPSKVPPFPFQVTQTRQPCRLPTVSRLLEHDGHYLVKWNFVPARAVGHISSPSTIGWASLKKSLKSVIFYLTQALR